MCSGSYLLLVETSPGFPSVCPNPVRPLGSSEAPSCSAMARGLVWRCSSSILEPHLAPSPLVPMAGLAPQTSLSKALGHTSYSQPVLVPGNRDAGGPGVWLRPYSWGRKVKHSPPCRGPLPPFGSCWAGPWELPSALCPLSVTGIPKVLPTVTRSHGRTLFPTEEQQGWHLQATWCFPSL